MVATLHIDDLYRNAPWGGYGTNDVRVYGKDWSDAAISWTFKDSPGGTVLIELNEAAAGAEGVTAAYLPDEVAPVTGTTGCTVFSPLILEATLNAIAAAVPPSAPVMLWHALHVTPADPSDPEIILCVGQAPLKPE